MSNEMRPCHNLTRGKSQGSKRVLITGAGGFVGRRLTRRLVDNDRYTVFTATRRLQSIVGSNPLEFDLRDSDSVRRVIEAANPDIIFHLAAQSSSSGANASPSGAWEANMLGTMSLARSLQDLAPDSTFVFASSVEVYGLAFNDGPVDENTTPRPVSVYGKSKYAAEMMLPDLLPHTVKSIIVRPTNHSGAGQSEHFVLPSFARQVASGTSPIMTGNIKVKRDFLHVEDVVSAYERIADHVSGLPSRAVFNISSGLTLSLDSILAKLLHVAGSDATISIDPDRIRNIDVPDAHINSDAIRRHLGWEPSVTIDELLRELFVAAQAQ